MLYYKTPQVDTDQLYTEKYIELFFSAQDTLKPLGVIPLDEECSVVMEPAI